jgi:nucleoside diphosphate kinase
MKKLIVEQLEYRRDPKKNRSDEHAVIILKPEYRREYISEVIDFLVKNDLQNVYQKVITFSKEAIIAVYYDIFKFTDKDLIYGVNWKKRKLDYMSSGKSIVFIIKGKNSQQLSKKFKYELRAKYKKLSIPSKKLTNKQFDELAIKNIIHVVDDSDTEVAIQLLINYL